MWFQACKTAVKTNETLEITEGMVAQSKCIGVELLQILFYLTGKIDEGKKLPENMRKKKRKTGKREEETNKCITELEIYRDTWKKAIKEKLKN